MVQKMSPKFETKLWVHSPKSKFLDWQLRVSQFSHMGHHNNNNRIIVFDKHELIDHVIQGFSLSTASLVTISWLPSQYPSYICIMWPGPGSGDHQQLPGSPDQPSQRPRGGRAFSDRDLYPEVKMAKNDICLTFLTFFIFLILTKERVFLPHAPEFRKIITYPWSLPCDNNMTLWHVWPGADHGGSWDLHQTRECPGCWDLRQTVHEQRQLQVRYNTGCPTKNATLFGYSPSTKKHFMGHHI